MNWFLKFRLWKAKKNLSDVKTIKAWSIEYLDLQNKHITLLRAHSDLLDECIKMRKELNGKNLVKI